MSTKSAQQYPISGSFHRLNLECQVFHPWLDDFLVIAIAELNGVGMGTRFENDVVFLSQTLVHIRWHTIEIAKGRHCSNRAVREERLEFLFAVERNGFASGLFELFKIDLMIGGKHCHQVLPRGFYHDNLGMAPSFYVLGFGDSLRGN